jgi:hypothetical protein
MNERIALLALKASDPKTGWLDRQKFAELIVRECMSVADFPKNLTGQWDHLESSEVIAAHFGLDK